MSNFRRRLMAQKEEGGDPFVAVVNAINQLPGEKSFLYKFDNNPYVYVWVFSQWSSTSQTLHVFDLNGNDLATYSHTSKFHTGVTKDNYICILDGTNDRGIPIGILYFNGSSITRLITESPSYNWMGAEAWYAYTDLSSSLHFCGKALRTHVAMWDYNVSTNSFSRVESSKDKWVSWYHYDGEYFRGLIWSNTSSQLQTVGYVKRISTTNNYTSTSFTPSIPNYYVVCYFPLFFYDGSYDKLQYEVYAAPNYPGTFHNVIGLETPEPTSLTTGDIAIPGYNNQAYNVRNRCGLMYLDNGVLHVYSYNLYTGMVELLF